MDKNLTVNPFTEVHFDNRSCRLVSPKPKEGLLTLEINVESNPNLFELLLEITKIRLDFLDIKNDLDNNERELLFKYGVIVEEINVPTKPLFSCQLDEIVVDRTIDPKTKTIVNPSFRYEPLDLGSFNSFAHQRNLLPYQSSAWVKTPVSDIEIGYWLNDQESEIVSTFTTGEEVRDIEDSNLLRKLIASEILISPAVQKRKASEIVEKTKKIKRDFATNKYAILQNLLPNHQVKAMQNYYREYIYNGFMPFDDKQVEKRYYQHNEPLATFLHNNLTPTMNLIVNKDVIPSYVYSASYIEDAVLQPHTDRPQCEFSFSLQVDYQPQPENSQPSPWGLFVAEPNFDFDKNFGYITDNFPANNQFDDENTAAYLANGDALIYKGCELIHYRYALPKGHQSTSLFFHYVPTDFQGEID